MNESDARAHFRAMGIPRPSQCLIDAWLRAAELQRQLAEANKPAASKTEETVAASAAPQADPATPDKPAETPRPGKSLLEPILREGGSLAEPPKRRKLGRPRIVASWLSLCHLCRKFARQIHSQTPEPEDITRLGWLAAIPYSAIRP